MTLRLLLVSIALATAVPAAAQTQAAGSAAESKEANSTVSLAVDPKLVDGRVVIKLAALNKGSAPVAFGPGSITVKTLAGEPVPVMPLQRLIDDIRVAAGEKVEQVAGDAPTTGAYASPPMNVDSSGMVDPTNYNGARVVSGDERIQQSNRTRRVKPTISKAQAEQQIAALKAGVLQDSTIQPGKVVAGQVVTEPLKLKKGEDRTLHVWVHVGADEHPFTVAAPAE